MNFAARWGYGDIIAGKLFGLRSTDPKGLVGHRDPVGPENDGHLQQLANECRAPGGRLGQLGPGSPVIPRAPSLRQEATDGPDAVPGHHAGGSPKRPLRLASDTGLQPFG